MAYLSLLEFLKSDRAQQRPAAGQIASILKFLLSASI
jgi:hypothetical protein